MGKITFNFKWRDDDISKYGINTPAIATLNIFKRKYKIDDIEQILYEGDDFTISIDIKDLEDKINWDMLPLPNEKIRQIFRDLEHYQDLSKKLDYALSDMKFINYDRRYELKEIGERAIHIISLFKPGEYFDNTLPNKDISIADITHTLNKEVNILITYIKTKDSQKRKDEAVKEAKNYLTSDIERFKIGLDNIKLKEKME